MILGEQALSDLRKAVEVATSQELKGIEDLRVRIRRDFKATRLGFRRVRTIAPVATDGGENRLTFEPLRIDIIRVADSEGNKHVERIIPITSEIEEYRAIFESTPVLSRMLDRLGVEYDNLSFFLPKVESMENTGKTKITSRDYANILRDIIEWAVLLDMAWNEKNSQGVLLLRDGLLRTKSLKRNVVKKLGKSFENAYKENNTLLLGVAKKSQVLNYISLAMSLEGTFHKSYPCYCEVPTDIERASYNWADTWQQGDEVFGQMHLVKLSSSRRGLILPVDVPPWLLDRRKEILEYLADSSRYTFPQIGYPYALAKAHDNAVLRGLEVEVIGSLVEQTLISLHKEKDRERIVELLRLGKGLQSGGW